MTRRFHNLVVSGLAVAALAAAGPPATVPPVELTTLSGRRVTGTLVELSADHASLNSHGKDVRVPLAEVLDLRTLRPRPAVPPDLKRPELALIDGSRLYWSALRISDRQVFVETPQLGKFTLPLTAVSSVRLALLDRQLVDAWKDLSARDVTQDMLVIAKANVLDHLDGTVGTIDATNIHFVLDGEERTAKRQKVFGIVYARRNGETSKPICELSNTSGDLLKPQTITWSAAQLNIGLVGGAQLVVPFEQVVSLDFSSGKVRYLSQLEPREVKYTPFFDQVWTYCRDRPRDGGALRLGNKEYSRGLWIHSRTFLKYRLSGDFRRFQAVMGIDQAVAPLGNVHVVISGDGKTLLESDVRGSDPPQNLDLDVAGVRDLDILVDFGGDLDIADHLDLADAKVIK
jgi:NPCBM/NEW2 domain-containing protein